MLFNDMVTFSFCLTVGNSDVLVQLVLLALDHILNSLAHFLNQENVELRIESILLILV